MNEQDVERLAGDIEREYAMAASAGGIPAPLALARVLAARVAAARADGRESLAGETRALADQIGVAKDGAARWARETSTSFREAMSRKVAYEWCEKELRALVAPTGHDGETGEAG